MARSFKHLTYEQRCQIQILKERKYSAAEIARAIGVHRSTIIRELRRNSEAATYQCGDADFMSKMRRKKAEREKMTGGIRPLVEEKLKLGWSPEQISGWMKKEGKGNISYETIYKFIWRDKRNGGKLYKNLRHSGKKYNKRSNGKAGRGCIPGRIDIKERPAIVEEKARLGDWELDTIIGHQHQGVLVSMVERASKFTQLVKVSTKRAEEVERAIIKKLGPLKEHVLTLTSDNGKEFATHKVVSESLEAGFFFATPYHSWERGLNEHTNGLVRQYFPKSKNLHELTDEEVARVEFLLNTRPRKILNFETPEEAFSRFSKKPAPLGSSSRAM